MASSTTNHTNACYADFPIEVDSIDQPVSEMSGRALHERLVAYTHLVAGDAESRSGVLGEHSYARAREAGGGVTSEVRELLVSAPAPALGPIDVVHARDDVILLPDEEEIDEEEEDTEWEGQVTAQAPNASYLRLAEAAIKALRELTLARLACVGRSDVMLKREQSRAASKCLRRVLAPMWPVGGARAAAWLHTTLCAALPRRQRGYYDEVLAEMRRSVPKLAERFTTNLPPVPPDPLEPDDEECTSARGDALLVWITLGEDRWWRRLRALVPTRRLDASPPGLARAPPDRWCAAAAATVRTKLTEMLADIGSKYIVLGGMGAGAALAATLATGTHGVQAQGAPPSLKPRALLLLSPPLFTAEGSRDEPDDILQEMRLPMLVVAGGGGVACGRGLGAALASRPSRRLLAVGGADDALRLPPATRRRLRLPQHALDAAIADECARWVRDVARGKYDRLEKGSADANKQIEIAEEEFSHLTVPTSRSAATRIINRVTGGTPLSLVPPRRAEQLEAADILQLPIVFADDDPPALAPAPAPTEGSGDKVTVRSGGRRGKVTRVIVARRGGARRPSHRPRPAPRGHAL